MEDELLSLLRQYVSFETVVPEAKRTCLRWIEAAFLADAGFPVERGDVNGAPWIHLRHPTPDLLWFAHADVVPGRPDQFSLRVDGDTAYGRGVKDMKGAGLAFLIAYRDVTRAGKRPRVSILFSTDEETGGATPPSLLAEGKFDGVPVAYTPDTGAHAFIVTELKGAVWARLIAEGMSGHGALPWESENPVHRLADALHILQAAFPQGSGTDWRMTVTPTQLHGSDAFNRVPAAATCTLDIRFPPEVCATSDEAMAIIAGHLPPKCSLQKIVDADPMRIDPAHPMVQRIKRLAEQVTGAPVSIGREHGSSDARAFHAYGIPAFLYGPTGGDLHGEQEWVSIRSLYQQIELNRLLLEELS